IALFLSRSSIERLAQRGPPGKKLGGLDMSTCRHVAFFAVFVDVEALPLDLRRNPQTDCSSDERANEGASDHGQHDRNYDCFQLLDPERVTNNSCQAILRGWVKRACGA